MDKQEAERIAFELVKKNHHYVIGTINQNGYPDLSVLIKLKHHGIKEFYFSTNEETDKIENLKHNPNGCIYCFDPFEYTGLTFFGKFQIIEQVHDHVEFSEDIFPEGLNSKNYVLLKFISKKVKVYHLLNKVWIDDIK